MTDLEILTRPSVLAELDAVSRALATPLLLLRTDAPDFHIVDANEAVLALVGTGREDLVGCGYFERFFPDPGLLDALTNGGLGVAFAEECVEDLLAHRHRAVVARYGERAPVAQEHLVRDVA